MSHLFNSVAIIGKAVKFSDPAVGRTIKQVANLLQGHKLRVAVDANAAEFLNRPDYPPNDIKTLGETCDLAIVVGGDGTMLSAARAFADYTIPLVGINQGRLGFLADITPDTLTDRLAEILRGHFLMEERFLLHATILRDGDCIAESNAFNDVIVQKWNTARMIEFDTFVNDRFINQQRSDGLIVSTPTGSTAYALSGGGPLLHPTLNAIALVPICPHTLSNRPIVVNGECRISIFLIDCNTDQAQLACDGQASFALREGDHIHIRKKETPVRLIHPACHDHFELLRAKLGWG